MDITALSCNDGTNWVYLFCLQNKMLEALSEKVTEVHSSCVDDRMINLSTLEKVANIENFISLLLEDFESIPEETLQMMRRIKKSEKRSKYVSATVFCLIYFNKNHLIKYLLRVIGQI